MQWREERTPTGALGDPGRITVDYELISANVACGQCGQRWTTSKGFGDGQIPRTLSPQICCPGCSVKGDVPLDRE